MQDKIYRVGILGMGNMGRAHANTMLKMGDIQIVALCSNPIADAEKYAKEQNLKCNIYADGFEMIDVEKLDVLFVCLPPFAHNGQVEAAAQKGIHVFNEKPIAMTVDRGASMAKAISEAGVHSQVGYHMRFGGAVQKLMELIQSGRAGKPTLFTARYECNSLHTPWWIQVDKCGGQVFEQVIHLYDMALYFMGEPKSVSGFTANLAHQNVPDYTVEDTSVSAISFKNGALGSISGSNCAVPREWNAMFRIVCENLVADFKDPNNAIFIYTDGETKREEIISCDDPLKEIECHYFFDVIRGKKSPFATMQDGLTGLKMVSGVVDSSKKDGMPYIFD